MKELTKAIIKFYVLSAIVILYGHLRLKDNPLQMIPYCIIIVSIGLLSFENAKLKIQADKRFEDRFKDLDLPEDWRR